MYNVIGHSAFFNFKIVASVYELSSRKTKPGFEILYEINMKN